MLSCKEKVTMAYCELATERLTEEVHAENGEDVHHQQQEHHNVPDMKT